METNLASDHVSRLFEVGPWGIDDLQIIPFVAFDRVVFDELRAVFEK